jgi:hypothetical protein
MTRKFPSAQTAAPLAVSKSLVETPMLRSFANLKDKGESGAGSTPAVFFPSAQTAALQAMSKRAVEVPMIRSLVEWPRIVSLRRTVSLDTVQNNYMRRTKILAFIGGPAKKLSLAAINNWIYSKVFLTPAEDPWLGLAPTDVFSAIEGDGRTY